jgi:hypothetical protein
VIDQDWDNLVVLDACRLDVFSELWGAEQPGELSKRISSNSASRGFLFDNFGDGDFQDIVYVTSNAWVNVELDADTFHDVVPVWKNGWDDDLGTIPPEPVLEAALDAKDRYPNKRLIIHFMQPHSPFIGKERVIDPGDVGSSLRQRALGEPTTEVEQESPGELSLLRGGEISREDAWRAYRSNLERVLPAVETLLTELQGRTVVTADHGEAFGEWAFPFPIRVYGHPAEALPIPSLVEVPWLVSGSGDRKEITSEAADESASPDDPSDRIAKERLRHLGYRES